MVMVDIFGVLRWSLLGGSFVMVVVDISSVLGRWPLLGGAHSSW